MYFIIIQFSQKYHLKNKDETPINIFINFVSDFPGEPLYTMVVI